MRPLPNLSLALLSLGLLGCLSGIDGLADSDSEAPGSKEYCTGVTLYEHADYKGAEWTFCGQDEVSDLTDRNDLASSIRVGGGQVFRFCEHNDNTGRCFYLAGDVPDLTRVDAVECNGEGTNCKDVFDVNLNDMLSSFTRLHDPPTVWPNELSRANSSPWLVANHDRIRQMRPRVLVLNFINGKAIGDVQARTTTDMMLMRERSRYHAYKDPSAPVFLDYQLAKFVDLADRPIPSGWTLPNSTKLPRRVGKFNYPKLFSEEFAPYYGYPDPSNPSRFLTLGELVNNGEVHEVWIVSTGSDGAPAEALELKLAYDEHNRRRPGVYEACAGNGCFDNDSAAAIRKVGRSLRIQGAGQDRGPGTILHCAGHSIEGMKRALKVFEQEFAPFGNFDFDRRLGVSFKDWYACGRYDGTTCLQYGSSNSVTWSIGEQQGTFSPFDQGCGNVHFPPNALDHYDYESTADVLALCENYGIRAQPRQAPAPTLYSSKLALDYEQRYCDGFCEMGGGWLLYWMQSFPGLDTPATREDGTPMKNWWPYLFY